MFVVGKIWGGVGTTLRAFGKNHFPPFPPRVKNYFVPKTESAGRRRLAFVKQDLFNLPDSESPLQTKVPPDIALEGGLKVNSDFFWCEEGPDCRVPSPDDVKACVPGGCAEEEDDGADKKHHHYGTARRGRLSAEGRHYGASTAAAWHAPLGHGAEADAGHHAPLGTTSTHAEASALQTTTDDPPIRRVAEATLRIGGSSAGKGTPFLSAEFDAVKGEDHDESNPKVRNE